MYLCNECGGSTKVFECSKINYDTYGFYDLMPRSRRCVECGFVFTTREVRDVVPHDVKAPVRKTMLRIAHRIGGIGSEKLAKRKVRKSPADDSSIDDGLARLQASIPKYNI